MIQYQLNTFISINSLYIDIIDVNDKIRYRLTSGNVIQTRIQTLPETDMTYLIITVQNSNNLIKLDFANESEAIEAKERFDQAILDMECPCDGGYILKSPNGTYFKIEVDDDGGLTTSEI